VTQNASNTPDSYHYRRQTRPQSFYEFFSGNINSIKTYGVLRDPLVQVLLTDLCCRFYAADVAPLRLPDLVYQLPRAVDADPSRGSEGSKVD